MQNQQPQHATTRRRSVEIAVQDVAGATIALEQGADRIELCAALITGGLTPSIGTIEAAVERADAVGKAGFVHVLIRPRPGGFVYSADERDTTVRDIRAAITAGAGGVVVGALLENGAVDDEALAAFADAAAGAPLTFHRAIDAGPDPLAALERLAVHGVTRVLTSGGAVRSGDGIEILAALATASVGRVEIMAGGGVTVEAIPALFAAGVDAVHLSAKRMLPDRAPSGPGGGASEYEVTDAVVVARAVAAARSTLEG